LVLDQGQVALATASGQVIEGDVPLLGEARVALSKAAERTVLAGELVAKEQPLETILGAGPSAPLEALSFVGLDLLAGGDAQARMPLGAFDERLGVMQRILEGGQRLRCARFSRVVNPDAAASFYREVVNGHQARGVLLRSSQDRLLKVMPMLTLFATIVGYTERTQGGEVGSLLIALRRPDGTFQLLGLCSHLGDENTRHELREALASRMAPSSFQHPGPHGELVRFVRPELAVELRANDAVTDDASGGWITSMALSFDGAYHAVVQAPTAHLIAPYVTRLLPPYEARKALMGLTQLADRCWIEGLERPLQRPPTGASQVLRREVWIKETRGKKAVRKLVAWKTNKEQDPLHPPYVVHWTDYSPQRREPLAREVHPAPTEASMNAIAERLVAEQIKKGWQRVS
ncbi:MAG: hypothetical protein RMJ98_14640, partial [Myxococcales bacterium]|nr:hypothetical protein [Polyangiaceae bacterium]MDW8250530.1 hypothetical protein [Myxococcales bacterium]